MSGRWFAGVLAFACLFALAAAELVIFKQCPGVEDNCSIDAVTIDPCPESARNLACQIKRRGTTKMIFDYTPKFDATELEAELYWVKSATEELPLASMDHEACKYTSCPVEAHKKHTYSMDVPIERKFPAGAYTIKWLLKDKSAEAKQCCFLTDIKVVRR